jgi:O-antigen/teichoic acid export membrane protein
VSRTGTPAGPGAPKRPNPAARRVILGSSWLLGGQMLTTLLAAVQGILLARLLGPSSYGVVALVTTFTALLTRFFDARSWETAVKFVTEFVERDQDQQARGTLKALLVVDAVTAVLAYGALFALAPLGASIFVKDPEAATLIRIYALTVLGLAPFGIATAILRIADLYDWMARLQAVAAAIELIVVLGVAWLIGSLEWLMWAFVVAALIRTGGSLVLMRAASGPLGLSGWTSARMADVRERFREIFRFWLSTNGFAVIKGIHQSMDTLLVGSFLGTAAAGYFRVAKNLSQAVSFPLTPVFQASYPELVRLYAAQQMEELARLFRRLIAWGAIGAVVITGVVWLLSRPLVTWTAGLSFLPAVDVLRLLVLGMALTTASQFGHALLMAMARLRSAFMALGLPVVLQLSLLLALVPRMGLEGAGWAFVAFAVLRGIHLLGASEWHLIHALRGAAVPEPDLGNGST